MAARPPRLPEGIAFKPVGITPLVLIAPLQFELQNLTEHLHSITPHQLLAQPIHQ